ncbi:hypothetical protein RRG08_005291 [Elysia crispata]|uniref:IRF tryptophan pentad repeat domain-containing protein n=1 Tax=Elysia crispata TaxID=231223 RepID=A0AAE0YC41_9GAST|nr:hypothetical protein RRG08_005291 [Elysia crispata]
MPIRQSRTAVKDTRVAMPQRKMNLQHKASKGESHSVTSSSASGMATRTRGRQHSKQLLQQHHQQRRSPPGQYLQDSVFRQQTDTGTASASRPLRMSQWLMTLLDGGEVSGLKWENREKKEFSICWVHKSNHNFDQATHSDIFSRYAIYRGQPSTCFSTKKASFRCALNSLKDVEQLTKEGAKRGPHATRTFRFLSPSDPKYGKNRGKHKSSNSKKGKKRTVTPQRKSPLSSTSNSWSLESASPSPPPSPRTNSDQSSCSPNHFSSITEPEYVTMIYSSTQNTMELDHMSGILQADWTSSCLEPVEERMSATHAMSPDDSQKAQVTFLTNADGITSVSAPMSGKISPPVEVKFSIPPEDQIVSTRVEVEPNIQSGGVVKGLPNFSELGVSDTYTPEEILVNKQLVCGGEVKVREGKSFALPIPIEMTQFMYSMIQQAQMPSQDAVCATQEDGFPGSSTSLPNSNNQTNLPQEYNDFDLGQTLEIRDGSVSNQDLYNPKYKAFTPQEDYGRLFENPSTETTEVKTYSNAVALLNDPLTCTVSGGITVQDALGPQVITEIQPSLTVPLPVEIQQIEQPDSLPLPDIEEEEWPDLFQMGQI